MSTGLEIMVKFRDKYGLQRLDPFKQSGGERSVSTALYMLAIQHLTQVRNVYFSLSNLNDYFDKRICLSMCLSVHSSVR